MKICQIEGCTRKHKGKGFCGTHLVRFNKFGNVDFIKQVINETVEQRFWAKVNKTEGCWNWTASKNKKGYGKFAFQGTTMIASRVAYILQIGEIPKDLKVLHTCDNPSCMRGEHLFLGTDQDNSDDKIAKGRLRVAKGENHPYRKNPNLHAKGEKVGLSKLTDEQVREMRNSFSGWKPSSFYRKYSANFGVHPNTIYKIIKRQTWRHI